MNVLDRPVGSAAAKKDSLVNGWWSQRSRKSAEENGRTFHRALS